MVIPTAFNSMPCLNITEESNVKFSPSQIDHFWCCGLPTDDFRLCCSPQKEDNLGITPKLAN